MALSFGFDFCILRFELIIMLIGHQRIWNFLIKSAINNRLAHAYLFIGVQGVGKKTVAIEFVKNLLCENKNSCGKCVNCQKIERNQHPDVLFLSSENNEKNRLSEAEKSVKIAEIKIEQIRQIQHQISLSPFCAPYKVVIIDGAELLTSEAANCLLKTLEEPPQKSLMILISSNSQWLLPTIISRCQLIKFLPVKSEQIEESLGKLGVKEKSKIKQAVKISCGRPGVAINLLKDPSLWSRLERQINDFQQIQKNDLVEKFKYAQKISQNISEAQEILNNWLVLFRDRILENAGLKSLIVFDVKGASRDSSEKSKAAIRDILEAKRLLSESSFNHRLVLENLMMKI